ncbi:flavodoxin [Teredinibacter sp. KSP-S5-2]|uniref:flavodoxin n=1 Tax=Teredinibacter sp. KSP-S5-2 TaxID=3034506 RepID=UPI002935070D|nr:flavodoxin [Teredinibacter sp. KSP-S5-2]WNO10009.1 flavodoxin [Teredinibacter sp. KSP-S5-2]
MSDIANVRIGLIFGTDTGNTEEVGDKICEALANYGCAVEMKNVADVEPQDFECYDMLIMGIPTWDFGGIQEDWEDFESQIAGLRLSGKAVALYGLGDQLGYGDYFIDAVGWLYQRILKTGARVIGAWPTDGYDFAASLAANETKTHFCGLAIDEDQQFDLTDQRVASWVAQLVGEYAQTNAA